MYITVYLKLRTIRDSHARMILLPSFPSSFTFICTLMLLILPHPLLSNRNQWKGLVSGPGPEGYLCGSWKSLLASSQESYLLYPVSFWKSGDLFPKMPTNNAPGVWSQVLIPHREVRFISSPLDSGLACVLLWLMELRSDILRLTSWDPSKYHSTCFHCWKPRVCLPINVRLDFTEWWKGPVGELKCSNVRSGHLQSEAPAESPGDNHGKK